MKGIIRLNKLDREVKQLEKHKVQLNSKLNDQVLTIKNMYSDPEYKDKINKLTQEITKAKEKYDQYKAEKSNIKSNQKLILNELANVESEHRQWKDKRMALEYNHKLKDVYKKEIWQNEELLMIK